MVIQGPEYCLEGLNKFHHTVWLLEGANIFAIFLVVTTANASYCKSSPAHLAKARAIWGFYSMSLTFAYVVLPH
jgi:hypothetical protein